MRESVTRWFECAACTFPVKLLHELNGVDEALDCGKESTVDDEEQQRQQQGC